MRKTLLFIKKISRNLLSLSMIFSKGMIFIPFLFSQQPTPILGLGFHCQWTKGSFQSSRLGQGEGRGGKGRPWGHRGSEALPLWTDLSFLPSAPHPTTPGCSPSEHQVCLHLGLPSVHLGGFLTQGRGCFSSSSAFKGACCPGPRGKQAEEALESLTGTPSHSSSDPCLDLGEMSSFFISAGTCATWR